MKALIYQMIEKALNKYLALDDESHARLFALEGKHIAIELKTQTESKINFVIQQGKIIFQPNKNENPDVLIKGTPLSLLHMSLAKENRQQFFAEDVSIEGDLELGQQIIDLFDELEVDWEEQVSKIVGDIPAHQVGKLARGFKKLTHQIKESLWQNTNEYVHEEALIFPPAEALQDFFADIDLLRMDVDRLEAKIARLRMRIANARKGKT